jgi:glycosyltransferase involved in cell wall biosynthesis
MRIGVNALYLIPGGVGGTEIYLRNLLDALARAAPEHDFFVFTNAETGTDIAAGMHVLTQPVRAVNRAMRLVYEQTELPARAHALRLDCLFNPGFTAPVARACPNVTVFHDLQHKRHPEHFRWFDLPAWRLFLWASVKRSQILIADSEATAADLRRYYRVPDDRIRVAPLGVEDRFFAIAKERAPEPFILCASTLHPHKNLNRMIRAFDLFRRRHPEYRLVITGVRGFETHAIERLVAELGCGDSVEVTGWIERERIFDLFRRAAAVVYPSTFEGFGLPVVEAMAAGVPLACSDIEPLRSMAGEAALRFPPDETEAIDAAMERLVSEPDTFAALTATGRERASHFTWESCARKTLDAIYAATEAGPRAESLRPSSRRDTSL